MGREEKQEPRHLHGGVKGRNWEVQQQTLFCLPDLLFSSFNWPHGGLGPGPGHGLPFPALPNEDAVDGGVKLPWCGTRLGSPETPFLFIFILVTPPPWQAEARPARLGSAQAGRELFHLPISCCLQLIAAGFPPPKAWADLNQRQQLQQRRWVEPSGADWGSLLSIKCLRFLLPPAATAQAGTSPLSTS